MILASGNWHKLREFRELLPGVALEPLPDGIELPEETGTTFAGNALIKARAVHGATGRAALADDSGIEVDALDGKPGIRSARYAGEGATDRENLELVLRRVAAAGGDRRARYVCVIALISASGEETLFEGFCPGTLIDAPRGAGGFGYDPAFVPDATGTGDPRTMAELEPEEKNAISHRGEAARRLLASL